MTNIVMSRIFLKSWTRRENGFTTKLARTLYVYPYPDMNLEEADIEGVRLTHLFEFSGSESPVRHISIKGFTFKHSARTFMDNREPLLRSDWTTYRGGAVVYRGAENCSTKIAISIN